MTQKSKMTLVDDLKRQRNAIFSNPQKGISRAWFWDVNPKDREAQEKRQEYILAETTIWKVLDGILERAYDKVSASLDGELENLNLESVAYKLGYRAALKDVYKIIPKDQLIKELKE